MEAERFSANSRRLPVGAEVVREGVHFRVWAPAARRVEVALEGQGERRTKLASEEGGYFSGLIREARNGARYRFSLDGGALLPDPASRFQPEGPQGPSEVVDPSDFAWTDRDWRGPEPTGNVIYELHLGTFTPEGTCAAAMERLPLLRELGVTVVELMPVSEFPGRFGWGYDGVDLFAPTRLYGGPDDLRRFVDRAHALGLAVILDVVYNHLGPSGNHLKSFAREYFTSKYSNEWGEALNFDGERSGAVRELFVANAGYWVDEFHLDGLRLDATQAMHDASREHVIGAISRRVREAARGRRTFVVGENEPQQAKLVRPQDRGGLALDALWNDDFHHSARVAATGHNEAYYRDYLGTPQELLSACKRGFLFQGQRYAWQNKRRGSSALDLSPARFVAYLQNHDQVANSAHGLRLHQLTSPGRHRALTALLLLGPQSPMLFQGQEWCASAPFLYFADHEPELARLVRKGRAEFLRQFPSIATEAVTARLAPPESPGTFAKCRLDWSERERPQHAMALALHRDLLALRRSETCLSSGGCSFDGAVLTERAFCLRWFPRDGPDRLLLVNLGRDLHLNSIAEPLLGPPDGCRWRLLWSSEDPRYGGGGTPEPEVEGAWHIPGECALLLGPEEDAR